MKRMIFILLFFLTAFAAWSCPVCERQQPKALRGIVHGQAGSNWDYLIVCAVIVISLATLFYAVKWLIRPGEKEKDHIKYTILNEE